MNAKERKRLIGAIETYLPLEYREPILRALRLLAAAEANDGETPQTDDFAEQDFVLETIRLHPKILARIKAWADHARRLERERNGLAARVVELEASAATSSADHFQRTGRDRDIILEALSAYDTFMINDDYDAQSALDRIMQRMRQRAAIDAAKGSKP